jgi:hypothetical protein
LVFLNLGVGDGLCVDEEARVSLLDVFDDVG